MTRCRQAVSALCLAIAAMSATGAARADDATELERGMNSYDSGRYAEGVERFQQMLDPGSKNALTEQALVERARAYYAACLIALGRAAEANEQIEKIIREDPFYTPDPVVFPGKVLDRFTDIKARMKGEIEQAERARSEAERAARLKQEKAREEQRAYLMALEKLAADESVVTVHSRWVAAVPFGVGQFQNGQTELGFAFLVSESLTLGASVVAHAIHDSLVADYVNTLADAQGKATIDTAKSESDRRLLVNISAFSSAAFALLVVGGVAQAELSYVPEVREHRKRPVPAPPAVTPSVSLEGPGVSLGVRGSF